MFNLYAKIWEEEFTEFGVENGPRMLFKDLG